MRRRRKVVIASAAVVALVAAAVVWKIATRKDDPCPGYDVVYDGYGHVSCEEGTVKIQPRANRTPTPASWWPAASPPRAKWAPPCRRPIRCGMVNPTHGK